MNDSYWAKVLNRRISRRRALAASGASALGTALLAACGGGDGDGKTETTGLTTVPSDTTSKAKKGGIWQSAVTTEAISLDQVTGNFAVQYLTNHVYPRMARYKVGSIKGPPDGTFEPDAAESWEVTPDNLKYTFKLRPNMKWEGRPPTNGRTLDSNDVKVTWERFAASSTSRSQLIRSAEFPEGPVQSVEYPDARTVVFKMAYPFGAFMKSLNYPWHFSIMPVEATNGGFDPKNDMRGAGPWMLTKYEPSRGYEYRRNPDWYDAAKRPFLEGINYPIILEQATREAQFKSGNLWQLHPSNSGAPSPDTVLTIKKEAPNALLVGRSPLIGNGSQLFMGFSKKPDSPWYTDVRLRRAASMLIDRDAWIDVFGNVSGLEAAGIPVETAWHSHVPCSWPTVWLDPKAGKLGEHSKWWQFNPNEAATLLRAADKFGYQTPAAYHGSGGFGGEILRKQNQVLLEMLQKGGHFKLDIKSALIYDTEFRPNYLWGKGQYDGISMNHPLGAWPDWDIAFWSAWTPGSRNDWVGKPLPEAHALMVKHRQSNDDKEKVALVHEWQKILARDVWLVSYPGDWSVFTVAQPWLGNYEFFRAWTGASDPQEVYVNYWYDESKKTA